MKTKVSNSLHHKMPQTLLLAASVLMLVALCVLSVSSPMRFDRERGAREAAVRQRLVKIRAAEEAYRASHGAYTGSFDVLVSSGLLADSLRLIPYSQGEAFALQVSSFTGSSGRQAPLMECGAQYAQYLRGLDSDAIASLTDEAMAAGRFPGLKIGSLEEPNNNAGNWE